mmetsp:Transcript_2491/g.3326  ORF Transcript_2491/g.3326 Transcript_2491/m.3326 type:complete len:544 (+) Transcript_2491:86-1717(+)
MMEESVPPASNMNMRHVQQRTASTTTGAGAGNNNNNNNTSNTNHTSTVNVNDEDDNRTIRRRNNNNLNFSSTYTRYLSPSLLLSKLIVILTFLFKVIFFPLKQISFYLFPSREFDGLTTTGVADNAAQAFVKMIYQDYIVLIHGHSPVSQNNEHDSDSDSDSNGESEDNELEERNLITTCPFTSTGYANTIESIIAQSSKHQQSITEYTSSSADVFLPPTELPPPLLMIYLHSPLHPASKSFITQKLCSRQILRYLNSEVKQSQLICWGGSIHTADGKNVQSFLNVTSYPFLALVRVRPQRPSNSNSSTGTGTTFNNVAANLEIYFKMEGPKLSNIHTNTLYTYMSKSIQTYQNLQNEEISRVITRQQETQLRNEQDREYNEALEEAQRREREKEEELQRLEEEQRFKEEEEIRIQNEKEEEERELKEKMDHKLNEAKRILYLYGDEPDSTKSGSSGGETFARIRFMLPNGKRIERKFRGKETIDTVKSFLILYFEENEDIGKIENFQLSSNYPKKALVDGEAKLESEGLCPQAVIMVQDLDA